MPARRGGLFVVYRKEGDVAIPYTYDMTELKELVIEEHQAAVREEKAAEAYASEYQACLERQRQHARACGELLIQAKDMLDHGEWLPWLAATPIPERTARRYMDMVREGRETVTTNRPDPEPVADFSPTAPASGAPVVGVSCYTADETLRFFIRSAEAMIQVAQESSEYSWIERDLQKMLVRLNKQLQKVS